MQGRVFVPESQRASIVVHVGRMEERAAKMQHEAKERERSPVTKGQSALKELSEAKSWTAGDTADRNQTAVSASQEQEDILEAWRKKRRQEMAVRDQALMGEGVHKPAGEGGLSINQEGYSSQKEGATLTQGVRAGLYDGDDEELLSRLRKRLGINESAEEPTTASPPPGSSPLPAHLNATPPSVPQVQPVTSSSSPPQNAEASSPELRHIARSFLQSPRGDYSHPLRFSSNTPPISPRRSLSPGSRDGKRSSSEPATRRMNLAFPQREHSPSDASSPSSSASEGNTPSRTFEFSPPSTPTSRGAIFEAPARRSSLLTAEDEALLAAMSLVGRSRSRSSPATKRLPRGNSGLPPQHMPPSQLRRAVSIDPQVEARATEQRAAEKSHGEVKRESLKRASLEAGSSKEGMDRLNEDLQRSRIEERGEKRPKRLSGDWAVLHTSEGDVQEQILDADAAMQAAASPSTQEGLGAGTSDQTVGFEARDSVAAETSDYFENLHSIPEGSAAAARQEGSGLGKGLNHGLVLQILGLGDDDELEGFGRFLSPVRTKVSEKNRLVRKRSNSFSEFTTIPSPPKMPTRLRGTFDKGLEEWSPGRARKGFGFAGSRGRKQAPMQPAVANMIAETVEDFWSSDLMGAWGMGQSETESSDVTSLEEMRPESAPVRRHILSEDPLLDSGAPQQKAFRGPPSVAENVSTSSEGGHVQPLNMRSSSGLGDHAQHKLGNEQDGSDLESGALEAFSRREHPGNLLNPAAGQSPREMQEDSFGDRGDQTATAVSPSDPRKNQAGMLVDSPQPEADVFDGPKVGHPRVGPPLMDDVFEDGPHVVQLREAIEQRETDIRKVRSGRDQ